jgi:signal transduction histidine kinase
MSSGARGISASAARVIFRRRRSAVREMKWAPAAATLLTVNRLPRGETLDRLAAGVLFIAAELLLWAGNATPGLPKGLGAPLIVAIAVPVAVRRRWPLAAGLVAMVANGTIFLVGANNYSPPLSIAWMAALYGIAVWTETSGFLIGLAVLAAGNLAGALTSAVDLSSALYFTAVPGIVMVIVRRAVRERQLLAEALAARAELLEREQQARASEAVAEERARIARELHDLVAHNVSVMVVQAGAERHALAPEQTSTREVLASIEQAGRQALAEARRLLGMLRRADDHEELEPQPSLDGVELLVEQVKRAGLCVTLQVEGERTALPAGVDLCAYRIVQESLTNALKHAGRAHAEVTLRYAPQALAVEVRDDGRGAAQLNGDGAGHGLIGMRERVALYGGELHVGHREGGGFEVLAQLPVT